MSHINKKGQTTRKKSIVVSGWPAVGKTTLATELAREFDMELYNGGDILKMLAIEKGYSASGSEWWDDTEAKKFMQDRRSDSSFDRRVDQKLIEIVKKGNAVITSYTIPWLVEGPIKFWLKASQTSRAKRMANRDKIACFKAKEIVKSRDEENKKIYYNLYGFKFGEDLTVFDYLLNTDLLSLGSLVDISKNIVRYMAL